MVQTSMPVARRFELDAKTNREICVTFSANPVTIGRITGARRALAAMCFAFAALVGFKGAVAQSAQPAAAAQPAGDVIGVELNKLEPLANGCRAYIVIDNGSEHSYTALKLDLVLFQTDGVIGRRVALDLSPVRPQKRSVKLFDLDGLKCDEIGSLLINDVMDCKTASASGTSADEPRCLERLKLATRTKVELSK